MRTHQLDDGDYLREIARLTGGRTVVRDGSQPRLVRLPASLGRGEVYFIRGGGRGLMSRGARKGVGVDLNGGSRLLMVIGGAGPFWSLATSVLADERPPVYFAPEPSGHASVSSWLDAGGREAIDALRLGTADRVFVYANGVQGELHGTPAPGAVVGFVGALVDLAKTLPPPRPDRKPSVPAAFAELQPFARKWTESDDARRSADLDRASDRTLRRLIDTVRPHLDQINSVLYAAGEPLSDDLIDLQSIAQAAVEAEVVLDERRRR